MRVAFLGLFAVFISGAWLLNRSRAFHWSDLWISVWTVIFLHLLLKFLIAFDTSARMVESKRDNALTAVLATRMSVEDVLRGEFLAARRRFGWPLLMVIAFDLSWLIGALRYGRGEHHIETAVFLALCLITVLIANSYALVWAGLHNSMRAKRPYRGALRAFAEIVLAPLLWFGFILLGGREHGNALTGIVAFTVLNLVNTWLFGSGAYQRFKSDLREILTEHPRPPEKSYEEDYALLK